MGAQAAHRTNPSGERWSRRPIVDQREQHERRDFAEDDDLDPAEREMAGEGENRPGQSRETLAESEDERNRLPRLGVSGKQEPVRHPAEDDDLNRRKDRGRPRGEWERRRRPQPDGRRQCEESIDVPPVPRESRGGREPEH